MPNNALSPIFHALCSFCRNDTDNHRYTFPKNANGSNSPRGSSCHCWGCNHDPNGNHQKRHSNRFFRRCSMAPSSRTANDNNDNGSVVSPTVAHSTSLDFGQQKHHHQCGHLLHDHKHHGHHNCNDHWCNTNNTLASKARKFLHRTSNSISSLSFTFPFHNFHRRSRYNRALSVKTQMRGNAHVSGSPTHHHRHNHHHRDKQQASQRDDSKGLSLLEKASDTTPTLPSSVQTSGTYNEGASSALQSVIRFQDGDSPSSNNTLLSRPTSLRHTEPSVVAEIPYSAGATLSASIATMLDDAAVPHLDRCLAHPGTRNDFWCETCCEAICVHCASKGAGAGSHGEHAVVKLAAAYDDAYEAVEELQIRLVECLTETRNRSTILDSAMNELGKSYNVAHKTLDDLLAIDTKRIDTIFNNTQLELESHITDCAEWRNELEETLRIVQQMTDEFSPHEMMYERKNIIELLNAAAEARPENWQKELPFSLSGPIDEIRPKVKLSSLTVPNVLDLGRKRGHIRVLSAPFSAAGLVWRLEVRRNRNRLGEPCLAAVLNVVDGPESLSVPCLIRIYILSHSLQGYSTPVMSDGSRSSQGYPRGQSFSALAASSAHQPRELFLHTYSDSWSKFSSHTSTLCTLDALEASGVLDNDKSVCIWFGIQPSSYRQLSVIQDSRIQDLEARIRELEHTSSGERGNDDALTYTPGSLRTIRHRKNTNQGWATSPRAIQKTESSLSPLPGPPPLPQFVPKHFKDLPQARKDSPAPPISPPSSAPLPQLPLLPSAPIIAASSSAVYLPSVSDEWSVVDQPSASSKNHRRALSLTTKLRRQPPISFSLGLQRGGSVQSSASSTQSSGSGNSLTLSTGSGSNTSSDNKVGAGKVLRRLSGWMKNTEGRISQKARRKHHLATSTGPEGITEERPDNIVVEESESPVFDDWTFLDRAIAPIDGSPLAGRSFGNELEGLGVQGVLTSPDQVFDQPNEGDFDFDGAADIEREQKIVDERVAQRQRERAKRQASYLAESKKRTEEDDMGTLCETPLHRGWSGDLDGLQERFQSIMQQVQALQLINNTVENSRDGFTEGTLRRVSSELGVLMDGRKKRLELALSQGHTGTSALSTKSLRMRATSPESLANSDFDSNSGSPVRRNSTSGARRYNPQKPRDNTLRTSAKRSATMDPSEIRRGIIPSTSNNCATTSHNRKPSEPAQSCHTPLERNTPVSSTKSEFFTASEWSGSSGGPPSPDNCCSIPPSTLWASSLVTPSSYNDTFAEIEPPYNRQRRISTASAASSISSSASTSRSPARRGRRARRPHRESSGSTGSWSIGSSPMHAPAKGVSIGTAFSRSGVVGAPLTQLTPQSKSTGGILKAGRSMRIGPVRINGHTVDEEEVVADFSLTRTMRSSTYPIPEVDTDCEDGDAGSALNTASSTPITRPGALRQVKSARASGAARKCVRFPEERKLLETIRLFDPRIAKSIEEKAAVTLASNTSLPKMAENKSLANAIRHGSPPPSFRLLRSASSSLNSDDTEEELPGGLAARVCCSPGLEAKPTSPLNIDLDISKEENVGEINDAHVSADEFDTATSALFEELPSRPIKQKIIEPTAYQRPPLPPQLRGATLQETNCTLPINDKPIKMQYADAVRTKQRDALGLETGKVTKIDSIGLKPVRHHESTLPSPNQAWSKGNRLLCNGGKKALTDGRIGGDVSGLSSPVDPDVGMIVGSTPSAHLYTQSEVFGDAQIPEAACGKNTALKGSGAGDLPALGSDST